MFENSKPTDALKEELQIFALALVLTTTIPVGFNRTDCFKFIE
jgi:hypothetical protein